MTLHRVVSPESCVFAASHCFPRGSLSTRRGGTFIPANTAVLFALRRSLYFSRTYRGASLITNRPPYKDFHRALGIVLL